MTMTTAEVDLAHSPEPSSQPRRAGLWVPKHLTARGKQLKRLESEFAVVRHRVSSRYRPADPPQPDRAASNGKVDVAEAAEYVRAAERAIEAHDPATGWALLHRLEECEVSCLKESEMAARAIALEREVADETPSDWRLGAAGNLLAQMSHRRVELPTGTAAHTPPNATPSREHETERDRALLQRALELRNEFYRNRYSTQEVTGERRLFLVIMGLGFLLLAGYIIGERLVDSEGPLTQPWVALTMAVSGIIGSITSAMRRLAVDPYAPTPLHLGSFTTTMTRPFIGGVAALSLYLAALGGLIGIDGDHTIALLVLAAFGSGFTERLIVYQPATK